MHTRNTNITERSEIRRKEGGEREKEGRERKEMGGKGNTAGGVEKQLQDCPRLRGGVGVPQW